MALERSITLLTYCKVEFPKLKAGVYNRTDLIKIVGEMPAGFWLDWLKWGEFSEVLSSEAASTHTDQLWTTMSALGKRGIKVLAVNSPSDQQVWAQFYQPLHVFVLTLPNSETQVIPGLTHALTPANFSSTQIDKRVIEAVAKFLSK